MFQRLTLQHQDELLDPPKPSYLQKSSLYQSPRTPKYNKNRQRTTQEYIEVIIFAFLPYMLAFS